MAGDVSRTSQEWTRGILQGDGSIYVDHPSTCSSFEDAVRSVRFDAAYNIILSRTVTDWEIVDHV